MNKTKPKENRMMMMAATATEAPSTAATAPAASKPVQASAAEDLARLEHEMAFGLAEEARTARRALQDAEGRNRQDLVDQAKAELRRIAQRGNNITINLLPLARQRAADAEYRARRQSAESPMPSLSRDELAEAAEEAERHLSALGREYAILPSQLQDAANSADAAALVAHRKRLDELPGLVMAAQASLLRFRIAELEAEEAECRAAQPAAVVDMEAARAASEKAEAEYRKARAAHGALVGGERTARSDAGEYRRRLAVLLAEQSVDRGPVVRSRIHAGRGLGNG